MEYDDQGQLRDPKQMDAMLDKYERLAASDDDVLLITFVHGWHHSAQPGDSNILSFREMLSEVSKTEDTDSQQQGRKKRKVIGIYIGWRGDSISVPYINTLTFWDRKNTAHDIGQQGITELLLKLEQIVNVKTGIKEENSPTISRLVVIGHSFGGAIVYTSLQKILVDRFIDSRRGKTSQDDAKGFGDLVVLINPAFEAMRFASLYDLSQQGCRNFFGTQLPKLVILTSEADYATKYVFPIGRFFSTLFESHLTLDRHYCNKPGKGGMQSMRINEGKADRNTIGHFNPYLTHRLNPTTDKKVRKNDFQIKQLQANWAKHTNDIPVDFSDSQLESLKRTHPLNPYLNISVHEELIDNHNDFWQPQITAFIRDLIVISTIPVNNVLNP